MQPVHNYYLINFCPKKLAQTDQTKKTPKYQFMIVILIWTLIIDTPQEVAEHTSQKGADPGGRVRIE
jgi:hypothetical protein